MTEKKYHGECYLCGENQMIILRDKLRHNIKRNVLRCKNCRIIYLEPKKVDLKGYYSSDYRKVYSPVIGKKINSQQLFNIRLKYQHVRIERLKHILDTKMKVLDIGCSTGHFLFALKDQVNECVGIEYNKDNANFAKEIGITVYTDSIENTNIQYEYFDLITIFQAFEHIEDPIGFLKTIYDYLKPDGFLCIEVPNIQDALISLYNIKEYCDFWFREPHIFYYSPETLSKVLNKAGFQGELKTIQRYNFINHINWILTGKPQKHMDIGMSTPTLVKDSSLEKEIVSALNQWVIRIDMEYKSLINKYELGDSILFIGKKI